MGSSGGGGGGGGAGASVSVSTRPPSGRPGGDPRLPLHIVTGAETSQRESPYNPQTEAISPTLPADGLDESPLRSTKDELLGQISTIDREIMKAESQIAKLKRKQSELELHAARPDGSLSEEDDREPKMTSLPQTIYADNRKRARTAKANLEKLKPAQPAAGADAAERWRLHAVQPLYNQPSDTAVYAANRAAFARFKLHLVSAIRRQRLAEIRHDRETLHTYTGRLQEWLRRVEQHEMVPKHRQCAARDREFYEKVFPEIRRMREERERPAGGGAGRLARPDGAEQEEPTDAGQQKLAERQRLLSLAVVPPPMLDARRRQHRFIDRGGLISEPLQLHDDLSNLNVWSEEERQTLSERYMQHPKQFHVISAALERHSTRECVRHYYLSKKQQKYKERLKKARSRGRTRGPARPPPAPLVIGADLPGMTTRGALQQRGRTGTSSTAAAGAAASTADPGAQPDGGGETAADAKSAAAAAATTSGPKDDDDEAARKVGECADTAGEDGGGGAVAGAGAVAGRQHCAVCQTDQEADSGEQWRPLLPEHAPLYGLSESALPADARVCAACRGRSARRRYPQVKCPIPTCPTPRQRVKRLRPLPARWADADAALRQTIASELQLTPEVVKCCTACQGRLARRLAGRPEPPAEPPWTDAELERLRAAVRRSGADWRAAAAAVGSRRPAQCRRLYAQRQPELGLQQALSEFRQANRQQQGAEVMTDTATDSAESSGEEDHEPASAAERRGDSSATVSADEASADAEVKVVSHQSAAGLQNHTGQQRPQQPPSPLPPPPQQQPPQQPSQHLQHQQQRPQQQPQQLTVPARPTLLPPGSQPLCAISPPPATSLGPRPSIGDLIDVTINQSFHAVARREREADSPAAGSDARDFTLNSLLTAGERDRAPVARRIQPLLPPPPHPQQPECDSVAQDLSVRRPAGGEPPPARRPLLPPAPPAPPRLEPPPDAYHADRRAAAPPAVMTDPRGSLPPHLVAAGRSWQQPPPPPPQPQPQPQPQRAPAARPHHPAGWPAGYPPRPAPRAGAGSITQGTPLAALDGLMRPPAPHLREGGSITQGTPMQPEPRRRDNPTTGGGLVVPAEPGAYPPRPAAGYPYPGGAPPPPADLVSSRHVLITDYITSQQMHGRRDSRGSSDGGGDPRASPRDIPGYGRQPPPRSTPPPARGTPPPRRQPQPQPQPPPTAQQRAGVIQRPASRSGPGPGPGPSRPPADSYQRLAAAPYGQDNFSTLVDVAAAQTSLMVPPRLERERQQQEQRYRQQQQQQQQQHQQQAAVAAAAAASQQREQQRQALQHRQQQEQRMLQHHHHQQQQQAQQRQQQQAQHQAQQQAQQQQRQNSAAVSKEMLAQAARTGRGLDKAGLTARGLIDTIINRSMTQESRGGAPPPTSEPRYQPASRASGPAAGRDSPRAPPPERPSYPAAPPPPPDSYGYRYRGAPAPPPPGRPAESTAAAERAALERARFARDQERHIMRVAQAGSPELAGQRPPPAGAEPGRLPATHQAWLYQQQQQHRQQQHHHQQQQQQQHQQRSDAEQPGATSQASRATVGASPLDYVKNKIAEVMRTSDKTGDDGDEPAKRPRLEPAALCLTRGSNGGMGTPPPPAAAAHRPRAPSGRGTPTDGSAM